MFQSGHGGCSGWVLVHVFRALYPPALFWHPACYSTEYAFVLACIMIPCGFRAGVPFPPLLAGGSRQDPPRPLLLCLLEKGMHRLRFRGITEYFCARGVKRGEGGKGFCFPGRRKSGESSEMPATMCFYHLILCVVVSLLVYWFELMIGFSQE